MRLGTAIMLATLTSLGTSLWHIHLRIRVLEVAVPETSKFEGLVFPLLFSTKVQVARC